LLFFGLTRAGNAATKEEDDVRLKKEPTLAGEGSRIILARRKGRWQNYTLSKRNLASTPPGVKWKNRENINPSKKEGKMKSQTDYPYVRRRYYVPPLQTRPFWPNQQRFNRRL
jgi:hypothetical protein